MHSHRLISTSVAAAFAAILLVGCASASTLAPAPQRVSDLPEQPAPIGVPAAGDESGGTGGNYLPANDSAYIVREGTLDVEVTDLPAALQQAKGLVANLSGYIAGSKESNDGDYAYASITYRFPVERWDDALAGLRALGQKVLSENTTANDVTADVVDMDARLANLRAAETQYMAIMAKAVTIDDVLKVQRQLNETRGQIEQLQAQRDNLANRAALATLTVNWRVPVTAVSTVKQGWDLGAEVDRAFAALVGMGQTLASIAIWLLIAVMPIVIPTVLIALVGYRILRPRANRVTMEDTPTADA
jgi:hypothetical protein